MENIKIDYIPVVQTIDNKTLKINKLGLIILGISISLISIYAALFINFINLIKIIY